MADKQPPVQRQMFDPDDLPEAPKKDKRIRYRWMFWLDVRHDDQLMLCEALDDLKAERKYAPTIRDALKLILSLRERRIDFLLDLFPWVEEYFRAKFATQESPANREFAEILRTQSAILEQLAQRPSVPAMTTSRAGVNVPEIDLSASIFAEDAGPVERGNLAANMGDLFADDDDDDLFDD